MILSYNYFFHVLILTKLKTKKNKNDEKDIHDLPDGSIYRNQY